MRDRLFWFGAAVSGVWIAGGVILGALHWKAFAKLEPNEWGDFFSGVFAPMAFLWLVLGFMQQGKELKLSTDALRLQAEELRNSVEQQRDLVEVSRKQFEASLEALSWEKAKEHEASQPRFTFGVQGASQTGGVTSFEVRFTNEGATASDVRVTYFPAPSRPPFGPYLGAVSGGSTQLVYFRLASLEVGYSLTFSYRDLKGELIEQRFSVKALEAAGSRHLQIVRADVGPQQAVSVQPSNQQHPTD